MGHVEVAHVEYYLPDGRMLLNDVSFRVGEGNVCALVGANGAGKTTLLRLVTGEIKPDSGSVTISGGLGVMPQFVGSVRDDRTVRDLLVSVSPPALRAAVFYGGRVAVLGSNGSGKSHFLRLLAGENVAHDGLWKLGARVVPGHFAQTHAHPELVGHTLVDILWTNHALTRGPAMSILRRYELDGQGDQPFEKLSGGQQARFQILLLEIGGATILLLDEPTDNLDLASAEALQQALEAFEGTTLAVTHDRGSRDPSTGTWSSVPTARCARPPSRSGTSGRSSANGSAPQPAAGVVDQPNLHVAGMATPPRGRRRGRRARP